MTVYKVEFKYGAKLKSSRLVSAPNAKVAQSYMRRDLDCLSNLEIVSVWRLVYRRRVEPSRGRVAHELPPIPAGQLK